MDAQQAKALKDAAESAFYLSVFLRGAVEDHARGGDPAEALRDACRNLKALRDTLDMALLCADAEEAATDAAEEA